MKKFMMQLDFKTNIIDWVKSQKLIILAWKSFHNPMVTIGDYDISPRVFLDNIQKRIKSCDSFKINNDDNNIVNK